MMALKRIFSLSTKAFRQDLRFLAVFQRYKSTGYFDGDKIDIAKTETRTDQLMTSNIEIDKPNTLFHLSGQPEEQQNRRARIYKPAKNSMQSGTFDIKNWKLDFENQARWENPLMGWTSTGDPKSNLNLWFSSKEDAIAYCERNGLHYEVDETHERRKLKKAYADNFSWNKRTRVGSK